MNAKLLAAGLVLTVGGALLLSRKVSDAAGGALDSIGQAARQAVDFVNPASPTNGVNRLVDLSVQAVTGDSNQTLGGAFHDFENPRAGLAANEYSPAPGIIVTLPRGQDGAKMTSEGAMLAPEVLGWTAALALGPAGIGYKLGSYFFSP